jgi:pimeloyl-ACP methyl ester carboxylesterase
MGHVTAFSNLQMARDYAMAWFQNDQKNLLETKTSYFQNSKNISTHNNWNLGRDSLKHMKKKSLKDRLKDRFKTITQPILIIHGADDSIPQSNAKTLCKNMVNARCVIVENTAHCPFDENPNGFYPLVTDFLDRLDALHDREAQNTGNQNVKKD